MKLCSMVFLLVIVWIFVSVCILVIDFGSVSGVGDLILVGMMVLVIVFSDVWLMMLSICVILVLLGLMWCLMNVLWCLSLCREGVFWDMVKDLLGKGICMGISCWLVVCGVFFCFFV